MPRKKKRPAGDGTTLEVPLPEGAHGKITIVSQGDRRLAILVSALISEARALRLEFRAFRYSTIGMPEQGVQMGDQADEAGQNAAALASAAWSEETPGRE